MPWARNLPSSNFLVLSERSPGTSGLAVYYERLWGMHGNNLPQKLMADVTIALEDAHEAAVQAQSPKLCGLMFEQLAALAIANARKAIELAESALEAHRKS